MAEYGAVKMTDDKDEQNCEVNHNIVKLEDDCSSKEVKEECNNPHHTRNYTTEVIELPNDGRVEIVASRRFGRQVTSQRTKDEVVLTLDHDDKIHVVVAGDSQPSQPNILQRCGARIPHGPTVLDIVVSGLMFVYSLLLTVLVAHVRENWRYMSIIMIWFFYVVLRMHTYTKRQVSTFGRKLWHFTGISFSVIFMYATLIVVFPMLIRDAFYGRTTNVKENQYTSLILSSLKASAGLTLAGMAARRNCHCGKILSHMDIINSVLLDNVDIFNLVETLGLLDSALPMITKGSPMEVCILVACEVAFLIIALEALMPYSLMVLNARNVGRIKQIISIRESKEQAILMVYPYSLLIQNVPFLVIRLVLFACYDTFQLGYVIKNITSILFGTITLVRAKDSVSKEQTQKRGAEFSSALFQQRRVSV